MICKWLVLTSFDHFPPFWLKNYAQSPSSQVHKIYQSTIGLMTMKSSSTDSSVEPCPLIFWYVWYVSMACDTPAGADSWRFLRIASANPIHLPGQLSSHEVWPSIANVQGSQRSSRCSVLSKWTCVTGTDCDPVANSDNRSLAIPEEILDILAQPAIRSNHTHTLSSVVFWHYVITATYNSWLMTHN